MNQSADLVVDFCSYEAAKYAVEHWHYSKRPPNQKLVKVGIWEHSEFIGCVLFGSSANNNLGKPYGLTQNETCELVRIALSKHISPVSQIVSWAIKLFKNHQPGIRLIISYADPEYAHVGTVYQAGNWIHTGKTKPSDEYVVNGARMHGRALRSTRSTHKDKNVLATNIMDWAAKVIDPNIRRVNGSSKYRYLFPLDKAMRRQIEPLAKPYPKRADVGEIESRLATS